jgi:hypothetical protein
MAEARAQLAGDEPAAEVEEPPAPALKSELAHLDERYAPTVGAGIWFRFRSGDPGLSRLFEVDIPLTLRVSPRHQYGHFTLQAVPVYLSAETADLANPAIADVFGTDGVFKPTTAPLRLSNQVWGFSVSLRYELRGFFAEVATTPIGFHVLDVIGQAGWLGVFGPWSFGLRGFRQAVADSLLSYGGLRDPRSGVVWGGVRREGGQLDLDYDPGDYQVHLFAAYAAYTGERVAGNDGGQYGLSGMWRLHRTPRQTLALGINLFLMNYAENLRYFTFGQGGYFSPQFFLMAGVPLSWRFNGDGWTLSAAGEVGVNWYQEDTSAMFPTNGILQAVRQTQPDLGEQFHDAFFPAVERIAPYGKLHLSVTHDLPGHFMVDASFDAQFAPAYSEILLRLALHKAFL